VGMSLGIFGTGYAGLVTSVCLAQLGHTVTAIDKDPDIVASLSDGTPTIHEPGLRDLLAANLEAGRLRFTTSAEDGVSSSDILFLCVGTPPRADGRADLCQVEEVARTIAPLLDGYKLIVEKSTVPARTADWIEWTIRRMAGSEREFDVASNPEFLREGSAVRDFLEPDRIVIGADTERARALLLGLYQGSFDCPIVVTSVTAAELIKHTSNAFLATKISFINLVSDLCAELGVDVATVARGVGLDPRIGGHFLNAGLGFGGSCLPKDLSALITVAEDNGVDVAMLREVERINTASPTWSPPSRRPVAPTRWSFSPTGRSFGRWTSIESGRSCAPRSSSTAGISSSRHGCGRPASSTRASAAGKPVCVRSRSGCARERTQPIARDRGDHRRRWVSRFAPLRPFPEAAMARRGDR